MARSRLILPVELGEAFVVADARTLGVGQSRLLGSDLERPFHGGRIRREAGPVPRARSNESPTERAARAEKELWRRIRAYQPLMPAHAFFVGPTAAFVHGAPLPDGLHDGLFVGVLHPRTPPRRAGVHGVQVRPELVSIVTRQGLRVSSPASTWAALATTLELYDLVAVADFFLRMPRHPGGFRPTAGRARATPTQFRAALDAGRRRASDLLRESLRRARIGSSSRPETWTRLTLTDGGLPEPTLDYDVYDDRGTFLGCSELVYVQQKVAIEFESDRHLTRRQLERDIEKYESYAAAGWTPLRLTSTHVFREPARVVSRVLTAL